MKLLLTILSLFVSTILIAQSVAINNDASLPDNTSILDIKSSTKGLLIPRMSTNEKKSILSPVIGLTVFDTTSYTYSIYRGDVNGGWADLQHNYQNFWASSGTHVYNTNLGNIGIGTNSPASTLTINAIDPVLALMNNGLSNSFIIIIWVGM